MVAHQWAAGDVLAEKYRLVQELGRGGMGAVWRAEHLVLRSPVAVKLVLSRVADSEPLRARFLREAQAAAALRSPHVVQILDFGVHRDTPFMVMELLEGESLRERLRRVGTLSAQDTSRLLVQVARALQKAQEAGIVHRDLKPDNVFLVRNGDEEIAKVLDFGIAKALTEDSAGVTAETNTGAVLGTPHYMSPEQARGTRAVDHRSDLWALGVIAFECLTGRRPFDSAVLGDLLVKICTDPLPVPSSLAPVPPGFDAWFSRALERDPERRFSSAQEMAEAFRLLSGGQPSLAPPPSFSATAPIGPAQTAPLSSPHAVPASTHAPHRPAPRSPLVIPLVVLLGLGAAATLGAAAYLWVQRSGASPAPSASALDVPIASRAQDLLDVVDAGDAAAPARPPTRPGAPATAAGAGDAGADWLDDVKKAQADAKKAQADAQKAREDAAKARAAAEALKQGLGGQK